MLLFPLLNGATGNLLLNGASGNLLMSHRGITSTQCGDLKPASLLGLGSVLHLSATHGSMQHQNLKVPNRGINTRCFLQSGLLQSPSTHHQGSSSNFLPQTYRDQQTSANTGSGEEEQLKRLAARCTGNCYAQLCCGMHSCFLLLTWCFAPYSDRLS